MKLCYIVYREDTVMVYESQVLEYLRAMKEKGYFESIELIVFRHEKNITKSNEVKAHILEYIEKGVTLWSLPVISSIQLDANAIRLKAYIKKNYKKDDQIAVICRGDLAAYIATKAFRQFKNSRILFDNRGLGYEESLMGHRKNIVHKANRIAKRRAQKRAKDHVDMYNFVTTNMRSFLVEKYKYDDKLPYTVIPTLIHIEDIDLTVLKAIKERENIDSKDFVITYIGSTAAWQSTSKLIKIINSIGERYDNAKFFVLSNGVISELDDLPDNIRRRIIMKSVPHNEMKYYLHMTDVGLVFRDNNIVNKVAAPTKIAEYLVSGMKILYSGRIGIIDDLADHCKNNQLICIDNEKEWIDSIYSTTNSDKKINPKIIEYFDMDKRQKETYQMIMKSFDNHKKQ